MSKKEIDWEKRLENCKSAFDMLKAEKDFLDSEENPNLDNFYTDAWYGKIDQMLGREEQFKAIIANAILLLTILLKIGVAARYGEMSTSQKELNQK